MVVLAAPDDVRRKEFEVAREILGYSGLDLGLHYGPSTFEAKEDAEAWLTDERSLIAADAWNPPKLRRALAEAKRPATFSAYAAVWLKDSDLKPPTRSHYQALLDNQLKTWDALPINDIRPVMVRDWHASLNKKHVRTRAHAYGLLRTTLATAVSDGLLQVNPCHIRGQAPPSASIRPSHFPCLSSRVGRRHARQVPADDVARRLVCPEVRRVGRVAAQGY